MDRGRIRIKALPYACTFFLSILAAQDITVEGTVIDDISGVAVSGVNIFLADSDLGTVSDTNGIFSLIIPESLSMREVVFSYIGYRQQTIPVMAIKSKAVIRLEPTVIPMQQVGVTGTGRSLEIQKDIPQPISVIESKTFELRGFTDAGDLLRTDHTVQLNENISGKKTVNIRGGNADEVAILYNGVRMNSEFDNIFDIALVDLQNVDHLEVIREATPFCMVPKHSLGSLTLFRNWFRKRHFRSTSTSVPISQVDGLPIWARNLTDSAPPTV